MDIPQRQTFLTALPIFATLSSQQSAELATLMQEVKFYPGNNMVVEDTLVDSVFIITKGKAEVNHNVSKINKLTKKAKIIREPIAIIQEGDAIGLNDTGFFSETGKRTATIIALTEVEALSLDLKSLHEFLKNYPTMHAEMYAASGQMLRVKLIKQSLPFSHLSYERLQKLASLVEEVSYPANTTIFKQGEKGDHCFLICSGQVEITAKEVDGTDRHVAILKTPTLFGEATLITHSPRNATARTIDHCDLLMIKHEYLTELIESESNVANMFMTLMLDRSRPLKNSHIIAHHRITADGQAVIILKNTENGSYFKLSPEGWFIWEQLNGQQTMQAITLALAEEFDIFAPDIVAGLISKLAKAEFICNIKVNEVVNLSQKPLWVRIMTKVMRVLEARIAIGDSDKWLSAVYNKGIHFLFTRIAEMLMALFAMAGFVAWILATHDMVHIFKSMNHSWILFLLLIPMTIFSVALHELGHAFATKSFGYEVHYMGVGWYWLSPVAFTDTSDMWLSTRWPRIVVNLAGVFTDVVVAGMASILIFVIPNIYIQGFLWIFAVYTYISAFRMLSPLQELDGYYVLMDLLERPHLRQSAVTWLVKGLPQAIRHPNLFREHFSEVIYWISCLVYLVMITIITLLVQTFIFKILGFKPANPLVGLMLPFLIVVISSLGIIAEIKNKAV